MSTFNPYTMQSIGNNGAIIGPPKPGGGPLPFTPRMPLNFPMPPQFRDGMRPGTGINFPLMRMLPSATTIEINIDIFHDPPEKKAVTKVIETQNSVSQDDILQSQS